MRFRDTDITFVCEEFVCPKCGMEAGRLDQAAVIQKSILEAYRKKLSHRARVNVKD